MEVPLTNTLAYYTSEFITAVKKFYETGLWTYRACSLSASGQPVARKRDLKESVVGMSVSLLNHCMVKLFGVRQEPTRVRNSRIGS